MIFGAIVEIDQQGRDVPETEGVVVPKRLHTIDHEVGGHVRRTDLKTDFVQVG